MFKKVILLALGGLLIFFLLSIISPYYSISKSDNTLKRTGSMYKILSVDSFEIESSGSTEKRDWDVSFSKYRSVAWDPDKKEHEEDNTWKTWVTANESEGENQIKRIDILPQAVYSIDRAKKLNSILSIRAKWDYKGYNWIDIYPSTSRVMDESANTEIINLEAYKKDAKEKNYILLSGLIDELRLWVWGMGFNYNIEIHLEDYVGNHVIISGGKINHQGWKEFHFPVPEYMKQTSTYLPFLRPIKFHKIRITTEPSERVDGCYIYLDYLNCATDLWDFPFEGQYLLFNSEKFFKKQTSN